MLNALIALFLLIVLVTFLALVAAVILGLSARRRLVVIEKRLAAIEAVGIGRTSGQVLPRPQPASEAGQLQAGGPASDGVVSGPPAAAAPPLSASVNAAPALSTVKDAPPFPPPPPTSVPPVLPPAFAPPSLEERFGTRWVVWAGGLALALGGIFLVRYSIEQGLIGPGVRIALGALLGAALLVAGEWLRRRENPAGLAALPPAYIPGILTAAGTTVCYATIYAAYALYGFAGPAAAFVLLGLVALATLAAAAVHGPALAALGLVGAEVTPLLVSAATPNYWALYVYLVVVTGAAFALARVRLWRWLAVMAMAAGMAWALIGLFDPMSGFATHVFHAVAGFVFAALLIVAGLFFGPEARPGRIDVLSSAAVSVYLSLAALVAIASDGQAALAPFALLAVATTAIAWRSDAAAGALPLAAVLSALVIVGWVVRPEVGHLVASGPGDGLWPEPSQADIALHLALGAFFAGLFGAAGYLAQGRHPGAAVPLVWSSTAVLAPLAILIALYCAIHGLDRSLSFAAIAIALAAWFAVAAERLTRSEPRPGVPAAAALHAAGSAAALALALTFSLEKGWLTVGLALMAPGVAWVANKRPLPLLRWVAAAAAALVMARILWDPRIAGDDLGPAPLFNWLAWGYGAPALAFWTAGLLLRRRADDAPSRTLDAAAILFTVLFAVMEIRHAMNGGDVYAAGGSLGEAALHVCAGLALAIGLEWLRQRTGNVVHNTGALAVAAVTLVIIAVELLGVENPRLSGAPVGGPFLNLILLGYGLPAGLAITLALIARRTRQMPYRTTAATVSVVLALAYLTLQVMRLYHGPALTGPITDAESYTFSAVWLAFGVALLIVGVPLDSKPVRLASAAVVGLATAKIFLFDLANLGGIWRALSFIGLGLVLVGIGWLYQRLLFPPRAVATP